MTKEKFLAKLTSLYRVANMSDSDNPLREDWTKPVMAATVCTPLDDILRALVKCGAITSDVHQSFYDNL